MEMTLVLERGTQAKYYEVDTNFSFVPRVGDTVYSPLAASARVTRVVWHFGPTGNQTEVEVFMS